MKFKYLLLGLTSALGIFSLFADSHSKCLTILKNDASTISVLLSEEPKISFALSENFNLENMYSAMVISTEREEIIVETLDNYKMEIGEVTIDVTDISLSTTNAELKVGESLTLSAIVTPDYASDKTVAWSSDNEEVASINASGEITAISIGEATITASCGAISATCKISVIPTPVESVTLNRNELVLAEGDVATLITTVLPDNTTDKTVTWTSSDESIAVVSSSGEVTAIAAGSTIITATSADGHSASCTVTVEAKFSDVKEMDSTDDVKVIGREIIVDSKLPKLSYSIYTTNGLIIEFGILPFGRSSINLSTYSSGTYVVSINNQKIKFIIK